MSLARPIIIESDCVSKAWGGIFLHSLTSDNYGRAPVVVSLSGFSAPLPSEDKDIRSALDRELLNTNKNSVRVSGMTIFPYDLWQHRGKPECSAFSEFCIKRLLPRLKSLDQRNRLGTYFERMMAFTGQKKGEIKTIDQLSFVIDLLNASDKWPRQSALQLSCFDPAKDHTGQPVRGFPCLQQISITHDGDKRIGINAYYPTQYIFDRGYGNYLGLCHLGSFIAHQTGLTFSRLNCFVGAPQLGIVTRKQIRPLVELVRQKLNLESK